MNPSAAGPYLRRTAPSSAAFYHKLVIVQLSANEPHKEPAQVHALKWDWPAAVLLLSGVLLGSGRLVLSQATDHLILVSFLAILSCIAGLALARSRFPAWLGAVFGLLYGLFFIPWQLGLAFFSDQEWTARLRGLSGRLGFAVRQLASGENVADPLLFVAAMAILFWLLGLNAGYRLGRRGDLWGGLLPFGLAALVVQTYDFRDSWKAWFLALFILCFLLLLSRLQFLKHKINWEASQIYIPWELSGSLARLAFASAALLVFFAWATPTLASSLNSAEAFWTMISAPWRTVREDLGRAFFPLQGGPARANNVYGERLALGRGIPQSSTILFTVEVIQEEQIPVRHYWRDRVYDRYENGAWTSSYDSRETWEDANADQFAELNGRITAQFLFTALENVVLLHTAPQPIALSRVAEFSFAPNDDGSPDLAALFAQSPVIAGESYGTRASLAAPTADQLREAGLAYPDWVAERYLQLPTDFSPRIGDLAQTLAEGQETPYDITVAITNYLRSEIEYVDQMPIAPFGRDPIEWSLFEQKQGFCNYYATAEVLMLRSLGIPARLAAGYAHGERQSAGDRVQYIVRQRDAHAWPEVYFPGIGWVEFEPTANQTPLTRPSSSSIENLSEEELLRLLREELAGPLPPELANEPVIPDLPKNSVPITSFNWRSILTLLALSALGAALLWNWKRMQEGTSVANLVVRGFSRFDLPVPDRVARWALSSELTPVERAYLQISQALTWLGYPPKAGDTPQQRSNALSTLMPYLSSEIQTLSKDYQSRVYSRSKVSREERALRIMKRIRWAARGEQIHSLGKQLMAFLNKG